MRRLSLLGVGLCLLYAVPAALCVGGAQGADDKVHFVLLQLPLTPQLLLPDALWADAWLRGMSWVAGYLLLVPPLLLLLYWAGHVLGHMLRRAAVRLARPD
ncbi:hypothetical protein K8O61_16380 [Xanthomonas cerealis pv. cerealis]|uniref:hypothetical protein n=1 Tax=Xanthomonas cerealis TaxID=3390025 RepID=UPI001F1C0BB0|nr:hypothetical protein [Xanthomonas translucens]UKE69006.1 hypothetical protein K8O61_16380 [Xanthomonas translucens pv. pistacia]